MVYNDCRFYGPYTSKKDGRLRCIVIFPNGKRKTISYPKYLVEVRLDRYLEKNETVDHIDGNFLNNNVDNLQVLDRRTHCKNDAFRNQDHVVKCQFCGKKFIVKGTTLSSRNRKDRFQSGYFCSRHCSGKYGKMIQLGLIIPTKVDRLVASKYQVKSAQGETLDVEAG